MDMFHLEYGSVVLLYPQRIFLRGGGGCTQNIKKGERCTFLWTPESVSVELSYIKRYPKVRTVWKVFESDSLT